jgi:solute carrier family 8 (sodium/calcium exchanger)
MIEAIKRITSRSEKVKLRDIEEKSLDVEKPIWNSQKSYITFLALASSAPEVFMCFFNTFSDVNKTPSRFGPIVLIGSASFNLLVVTGVAVTASIEAKRVENSFALWTMAAFATAAYFWLYLVLQVITPGQIDFTEALVTLLGYPALITVIWLNDRFNESTTDDQ